MVLLFEYLFAKTFFESLHKVQPVLVNVLLESIIDCISRVIDDRVKQQGGVGVALICKK
jgi:hypothetical protein